MSRPNFQKEKADEKWQHRHRTLLFYDLLMLVVSFVLVFLVGNYFTEMAAGYLAVQVVLGAVCVLLCREWRGVYRQIWRYGDTAAYIRLIEADGIAGVLFMLVCFVLPLPRLSVTSQIAVFCFDLVGCVTMRLIYQFLYQGASRNSWLGKVMRTVVRYATGLDIPPQEESDSRKIKIAIVGVGHVGSMLARELFSNSQSSYLPVLFIDIDPDKIGRQFHGVTVVDEKAVDGALLSRFGVQELVFAIPDVDGNKHMSLYQRYHEYGYPLKTYDYPLMQSAGVGDRHLRRFGIEDLLFREERRFANEETCAFYRGKTVLITGGGGSIGSELCRQIARMQPAKIVILDIYENGAYDVQQELRLVHGNHLSLQVEIASVCDREQLARIFAAHRPQIVIHAAAHKHVPLMEHNCCEAVRNNVFGTLQIVETAEEYGVEKLIMVSTDKAVNPTNVMGATKRLCEMIVRSRTGSTRFSATRFGNVLGSNGSVIPLFKRQIANGGPVTITDRRIIRYFMTIPEASQLVLQSGAMAGDGELYVLDMGKPVRILDLAENMIRLSGLRPYIDIDIVETGLREGEKLYEELLIESEELGRTNNALIFIEKDEPLSAAQIGEKLAVLRRAMETGDDEIVKAALKAVVPTYHDPSEVNAQAIAEQKTLILSGEMDN